MPALPETAARHRVTLLVGGTEISGWESYDVSVSLTEPGTFTLRMPFDREAWDLCKPDREVRVLIDGVAILTGFIDDCDAPEDGDTLDVVGRDKIGRLVQESAPGINFGGLAVRELIAKLASPWFASVTLSNARNRNVIRGRGRKARASGDDLKVNTRQVGTQTEPGQTRWSIIEQLLEQSSYLAWSSGDGEELIVGQPNYSQVPQYTFFKPAPGTKRARESTVLGMGIRRSVGDRYSRVLVVGSGHGTDANYGAAVAGRWGEAKNNPATFEGEGLDFIYPKRLVVVRSLSSTAEAKELAEREMARRDAQGSLVTVRAPGHGQVAAGLRPTLFAPDTLANVEDERTGTKGTYVVVSCTYRSSRDGGEETQMQLAKKGSELGR